MKPTVTSKQPHPHHKRDWYPYYAGYPNDFVDDALESHFDGAKSILDPWNGSGTTTTVAAFRGMLAHGVEINPAATIIARARLTPTAVRDSLEPLAKEIALAAHRVVPPERRAEPLAGWLRGPAIGAFRSLQHAVHEVLTSEPTLELALARDPQEGSTVLGQLPSFYYTALFATARQVLAPFKASNPTWLRNPASYRHRINPDFDMIVRTFVDQSADLAGRLLLPDKAAAGRAVVRTGSVLKLDDLDVYDACLTSPPYATRVDYVRSSIAELAVLGLGDSQVKSLRQLTTGTPLVRGVFSDEVSLSSECARRVARRVRLHTSHGSKNYYGPWIYNYLRDLQGSLERIDMAIKSDGTVGLVVQNSYYKEVHIDLQAIVTETMEQLGRPKRVQVNFPVRRSLARMNPAAKKQAGNRTLCESLLVFGNEP